MKSTLQASDFDRAFATERAQIYPAVSDLEARMGYGIARERLECAARTLACPVKVNPPNWQHGRVLYAALMKYLEGRSEPVNVFDCGTAKGFSALCMAFALADAKASGKVHSVDVIDPNSMVPRNSILDLERPRSVREFVLPWQESDRIEFHWSTGINWLKSHPERVHFAFVDGKHSEGIVREEAELLAARQQQGDVSIFDDMQIPGVHAAVVRIESDYSVELLIPKRERQYAVATRR